MAENKLLSKRVNFPSVGAILDDWVPRFAHHFNLDEKQSDELRQALTLIFEHFLSDALFAAKLGAEKGMAEAFELFKDPAYHEVVKKRKAKERESLKEWRAKNNTSEKEHERRRNNPTREEKVSDIRRSVHQMAMYRKEYRRAKEMILKYVEQDGSEILGEFIKDEMEMPDLAIGSFDIDAYVRAISEADIQRIPKENSKTIVNEVEDFFDANTLLESD